jgi:hypothetical protein
VEFTIPQDNIEPWVFDFDFDVKNICDHLPQGLETLYYMNPTQL